MNEIPKEKITYENLIESDGFEIIDSLYMGSYDGDLLVMVKKDHRFGLITTGFGSCSACDLLQAAIYHGEKHVKDLRDTLCNVIMYDGGDFINYLDNKNWDAEYYRGDKNLSDFISRCKEMVALRYLAGV